MKYTEEYANFNGFYYDCLDSIIKKASCSPDNHHAKFLKDCEKNNIDFEKVVHKKFIDNYQDIETSSGKYMLLPLYLINLNVPRYFIKENSKRVNGRYRIATLRNMFFQKTDFKIHHYSKQLDKGALSCICNSYIKYYKESLSEEWAEKEFYKMLSELEYLSMKYAIDNETNEIFVVGFFGAYVRSGAGGQTLTNGELYVMPEFRNLGIAKKLVGVTFDMAKESGIDNFDSITYRIKNQDSLAFWESIGQQ